MSRELRALIWMADPVNTELAGRLLTDARVESRPCWNIEDLGHATSDGAGVLLLEQENLEEDAAGAALYDLLGRQPPWSDIPVIVLVPQGAHGNLASVLQCYAEWNVTALERPMTRAALLSVVRTSLRARRRQYEVRDLLEDLRTAHRVQQHRAEQLARLASELTLAEQRERLRLAHILHDHLQQLLVAAKFGTEGIAARARGTETGEAAMQICALLDESIQTSRSLTVELSPPILHEEGLAAGIEWLARRMREKHGLRVELRLDRSADPHREDVRVLLFESVRELLFNVVKHAGVHEACVELSRQGRSLRIAVRDRGAGLDPRSVWTSSGSEDGGFGLLTIRERLHLLGGGMEVSSAPGEGTEFTLSVVVGEAKTPPAVPPDVAAASLPLRVLRHVRSPVTLIRTPAAPIRVLLADDHVVVRQGLSALLEASPDLLVVGEASDGVEAVDLARRLHPDVVLMDFSLPGMNGTEATRIIHAEFPHIRIIGLSMYEADDVAQAMRQAGAEDFVTKSAASETLLSAIRNTRPKAA